MKFFTNAVNQEFRMWDNYTEDGTNGTILTATDKIVLTWGEVENCANFEILIDYRYKEGEDPISAQQTDGYGINFNITSNSTNTIVIKDVFTIIEGLYDAGADVYIMGVYVKFLENSSANIELSSASIFGVDYTALELTWGGVKIGGGKFVIGDVSLTGEVAYFAENVTLPETVETLYLRLDLAEAKIGNWGILIDSDEGVIGNGRFVENPLFYAQIGNSYYYKLPSTITTLYHYVWKGWGSEVEDWTLNVAGVYITDISPKLSIAIAQAELNYISIAAGASAFKTVLDGAKALRDAGTADAATMDVKADELLSALNTYFKAQMIAANDKSSLITNATFDTNGDASGWTSTTNPPAVAEGVGEFFGDNGVLSQEITLDNGYYLVYVQAFYRDVVGPTFFANDKSVALPDMYSQATEVVDVQNMWAAATAFAASADNYANYLLVEVTDGTLTIGLEKPDAWHWLCFDNFKLYKIVEDTGSVTALTQVERDKEMDENLPVYNLAGMKVGVKKDLPFLNSGIYIVGGKKIFIQK